MRILTPFCVYLNCFWSGRNILQLSHGFLNERARYLREGISLCSGTTSIWVSEHSILLEKCCSRLRRDTKEIQLYEIKIAASHKS